MSLSADTRYRDLTEEQADVVDMVMMEFGDLFDNDGFGPFIQEFTGFGPDRYAQLLRLAIGDIETMCSVAGLNWDLDNYPYKNKVANRCLVLALTVEVIKHLIRTYAEIPDTGRVSAPDIVRRDYQSRWSGLLNDYQNQLKDAVKSLGIELYNDNYRHYTKVLVDLNSMRGIVNIDAPAERPMVGWWW